MASMFEQGSEEGLKLLEEKELGLTKGMDLYSRTPDLPDEQQRIFGKNAPGAFKWAMMSAGQQQALRLREENANIEKLKTMIDMSDKVIKRAHTLKGEERTQFLNKILPSISRVFPEAGKTIKTFAENESGYEDVLKHMSDPEVEAIVKAIGSTGDFDGAMKAATTLKRTQSKTSDPQVTSPTKGEREQIDRYIERNWPEDVPDLGDQKTDFVDILGNKAKKIAKKKRISLDDALNEAWPEVYKENIAEGEKTGWFDLKLDTSTSLKARQEVQKIVEEYTRDNPATVASQEEFKKLPVGSWFINPADNRLLRKKGGK